jgi:dipeptidyl aminopeptidase/acylaminoacyl peptidase
MMQQDIRETTLYREAEALFKTQRRPATGQISDAAEVHVSPDGKDAVFAGSLLDSLEGVPPSRIIQIDLTSGDCRILTLGPNTDRLPKYSPNGRHVAFLSDRHRAGDFQLYLLDPVSGAVRSTPSVEGWVEYLHWSPDGKRILLGVAGHGADISGGQGAVASQQVAVDIPSWMPAVDTGDENCRWRRAWLYELATDRVRRISHEALAAVASPGPGEGLWYSAHLQIIDIETGGSREIYTSQDQLGWPAASPSGRYLAIVEAICSDRWVVAGDLRLIETTSGKIQQLETKGVDITHVEWRSDGHLLVAGHRGFEAVVGLCNVALTTFTELWCSTDVTGAGRYITVSGFNDLGDCVLVGESFMRAPEIAVIRQGNYQTVKSFDLGYADQIEAIDAVDQVSWKAPDGLEMQGWLLQPKGNGPHPLVMVIHGGPVWQFRPTWLGRWGAYMLMLVIKGYAVFLPNPRGSSGRGQDFARRVLGDMGGTDTNDYLSGLDHLVAQGIADHKRIGVTGVSYGGFMTSWLITQDSRFAAAVSVAPVTNHVTQHLIGNIPQFVAAFLSDAYTNPNGKYFERSPVMHAQRVRTPTLNICGALDRCTPPEEALQFHNALLGSGARSVLVVYPEEGHGIRRLPAAIDYTARVVSWFEEHMPARAPSAAKATKVTFSAGTI